MAPLFAVAFAYLALAYPGPAHLQPTIHFARSEVADGGGWHDIAGAFTHKATHHIFQGMGWNHATSADLVSWAVAPHGPNKVRETYAGMDSLNDPCSGFVTMDEKDGSVCAGFRQCSSYFGVAGGNPWDVPLELRCALDDNLTTWDDANPEYLFNVSFWRAIPYDPARPWKEADGNWYAWFSVDKPAGRSHPHRQPAQSYAATQVHATLDGCVQFYGPSAALAWVRCGWPA